MKTRYNFHLDDEHLAHLRDLARRESVTVSEIIRYAITDHLQRYDPRYLPANPAQGELDLGSPRADTDATAATPTPDGRTVRQRPPA